MNSKKTASCGFKSQSTVVAGKKRVRNTLLRVWLSPDERAKIQERMADAGIRHLSAYIRKMTLNGYVLHVDFAPVKDIVSLQRRCANNLNQISVFDKGIITRHLKNGANLHQTAAIGENSRRRFSERYGRSPLGAALFWLSQRSPADPGHSLRKV